MPAPELDAALQRAVDDVPGVVAALTDGDRLTYAGAAGARALGGDAPMTLDTVFAIYSATKPITTTTCLTLVDDGSLDLDAPAAEFVPELGDVQVLTGFAADGAPALREPTRQITTRMLLQHTAGFGYDFFNESYNRLGPPSVATGTMAALRTPLLFDPGTRWEYGSGVDWAGLVVEAITGQRLGDVMRERVFEPLGMVDTAFTMTPAMRTRRATMHQRRRDGSLRALPDFELPQQPEVQMGGHGLYSTALDFARFMRMWLTDGAGVLRPSTLAMATAAGPRIHPLPGVQPALTHPIEFFPGVPKSWGLGFMINEAGAPTGRRAKSLAWAGLVNVYFWIDRAAGIAGFWATQLLPFADPSALAAYLEFERAAYSNVTPGSP